MTSQPPVLRRRRRWWIAATLAALLVVAFGVVTARVFVWPDLPAIPERADAIIELAGPGDGGRDAAAIALAREHRARFLVQSTQASDLPSDSCLPHVAAVTILCFSPEPATTQGEARSIAKLAETYGWTSVILVTTPDQAWRARLRVSRCFSGAVYVQTSTLPWQMWPEQIAYQWLATAKALTVERSC